MSASIHRLNPIPSRKRKDVTISDFVRAFESHHKAMGNSQRTIDHYLDSLTLFQRCLGEYGIVEVEEALTSQTMNLFSGWLRDTPISKSYRGTTQRTIHGVHGALKDVKAWTRWLLEEELIEKAPKVPVPKLPTRLFPILTDDELRKIFSCRLLTERSEQADRNKALLAFMLDTGVRLSEAANLQHADIDMKQYSARIVGKGNKERLVYFSENVAATLKRWIDIRGTDEGSLFWLKAAGIKMLFRRIQIETGIERFHPHQVRHTTLTMLVKQDVDLHTIKRIAGHASVTTTEGYLNLSGSDIRAKHAAASPFNQVAQPTSVAGKRRLRG